MKNKYIFGLDIGGTKSAVLLADIKDSEIVFLERRQIPTRGSWKDVLDSLLSSLKSIRKEYGLDRKDIPVGISCGGPLNSKEGIILSPPNLPGWDRVEIVKYIKQETGLDARLKNDADACALAEWKYGAGRGYSNVIFLTFGTGLGAGLILNDRLYTGRNDMAGEVGHIRLSDTGPIGYGKEGSFEGFCSGGGIAQLGQKKAKELLAIGKKPLFLTGDIKDLTTKDLALAAESGDKDAIDVFNQSARMFGYGLSILIDILNPDIIVAGSVYSRVPHLFKSEMERVINEEALFHPREGLEIAVSKLGERIGDYATIMAALY